MTTPIRIWRLSPTSTIDDKFPTEWTVTLLPQTYDTIELAKHAICEKTRTDPEICGYVGSHLVNLKTREEKLDFLNEICFTNNFHIRYRRYFLEKPTVDLLKLMGSNCVELKEKPMAKSFQIWQLKDVSAVTDVHQTLQKVLLPETYDTIELAKFAVFEKTKIEPGIRWTVDMHLSKLKTDAEKTAFMNEFCFTNDLYSVHRRYFLEEPQLENDKQENAEEFETVTDTEQIKSPPPVRKRFQHPGEKHLGEWDAKCYIQQTTEEKKIVWSNLGGSGYVRIIEDVTNGRHNVVMYCNGTFKIVWNQQIQKNDAPLPIVDGALFDEIGADTCEDLCLSLKTEKSVVAFFFTRGQQDRTEFETLWTACHKKLL